ncbi:MAG: HDIG domain-containing protein [Bacteroidaceae bacterium]|nr:HDIG domain-containing protein [Bacteroidaceae bacterium]
MKNKKLRRYALWVLTPLLSAALIIFFLPRQKTFKYDFDKGKPWRYEQLTADWDFAVEKSDQELREERAQAASAVTPYYRYDDKAYDAARDSLQKQYTRAFSTLMPRNLYRKLGENLATAYQHGILSSTDQLRLAADSTAAINVIKGTSSVLTPVSELYTVQQAYELVMQTDTSSYGTYVLQSCNLNDYIRPNLAFDDEKTSSARADAADEVPLTSGIILSGQKIIDTGDIVDEQAYQTLVSYRKAWTNRNTLTGSENILFGQTLLVAILLAVFISYLAIYRRDYIVRPNVIIFLATQLVIFPVISSLVSAKYIMMVPFVMAPVMVRVFLDSRTATMLHVVVVLISSLFLPEPYLFILLQLAAGIIANYSLTELTERSQLFRTALIALAVYLIVWIGYELAAGNDLSRLNYLMPLDFLVNAILLLFTYPLLYLFEKLFHFTSNVTLVELSNINNKLLRKLSEEAPGTFNHSMQMANLAAAAANEIDANSQLVRTGALYHDIGKLKNPAFFTENQAGVNPHDRLSCEQSAEIIIQHVADGLKLADKYHLPDAIRQFIATHHGTSKAKYFYVSYCNEHPGEDVDESLFSYPGPDPSTVETALLMMADAVEAASRSLKEYTEESISTLVDRIIDSQVADGCFASCPITFLDIQRVKAVFKEKLRTMYHTRISYPELNAPAKPEEPIALPAEEQEQEEEPLS